MPSRSLVMVGLVLLAFAGCRSARQPANAGALRPGAARALAGGPAEDASWLQTHAWAPAEVTDPALVGSIPHECLRYRRKLHREVLEALEGGLLSDRGKAEAFRLLAILRAYDKRSMAALGAGYALRLEPPEGEFYVSPMHIAPFDRSPGEYALALLGLPAVPALLAHRDPSPDARAQALPDPLGIAVGLAARPILAPLAGVVAPVADSRQTVDANAPRGSWHYDLRRKPAVGPLGDLVETLNSDDPATRVKCAADLIRRQREAEQWLAEALAQGNPHSAGWGLRDKPGPDGGREGDYRDFVDRWPEGREPPKPPSDRARLECIEMLAEIRPLNLSLVQLLHEYLTFMPETWPHPVPPAGFALARIGVQSTEALAFPREQPDLVRMFADPEKARSLPPEQRDQVQRLALPTRETELGTLGLMLGRFAADTLWATASAGGQPAATPDEIGVPYLREHYAGAKAIWEYIPDEPPPAE